ncbi:nephrin-like [Macrobrachium nipponense]|uniref:nephrin-like n=1 Tax=Macrobrachium nipponense TaxID=159736 RepID=UPI0030C7DB10
MTYGPVTFTPATPPNLYGYHYISVFGQEQAFTISPHSVRVNVGEDVFLKCVIQNQQGKAQWTKDGFALVKPILLFPLINLRASVSFLQSHVTLRNIATLLTRHRPLSPLGFERDVPGYPRHSYSGNPSEGEHHLVIKGTTLDDDGKYQCQVGPTANTSALVASANVTVMVAPRSLSIIRSADSSVVQGTAGHNLYLQCLVSDARPAPSIAWYRNGIMLDKSLHTEKVDEMPPDTKRWSVRSRLLIVPEVQDEGQQYTCRALHPAFARSHKALVDTVTLSVLHPPNAPVITGYTPGHILKEGELLSLSCQSMGGNPRPQLSWYRDGRLLRRPDINHSKAGSEDEGTKAVIGWAVTEDDDGAVYECRAQNEVSGDPSLSDEVALSVLYGPSRVEIAGPSVATAGQEFVLKCVTSKANPAASINWIVHGIKVAPVSSVVSEGDGGGWVTSSYLKYHLERSMKLSEITVECQARNALSKEALNKTRVISIMKPPGHPLLKVEGMEDLVAGGRLIVFCISEGGNPNPGITWVVTQNTFLLGSVTGEERHKHCRIILNWLFKLFAILAINRYHLDIA